MWIATPMTDACYTSRSKIFNGFTSDFVEYKISNLLTDEKEQNLKPSVATLPRCMDAFTGEISKEPNDRLKEKELPYAPKN